MKKVITLVLAVVLVLAMAAPAFAVGSPVAPVADEDKTTVLPVVVESVDDCVFLSIEDADKLPEEAQKEFIAAQEALEEAIPEGMTVKYFFYHIHTNGEDLDELCEDTFDIGEFEEAIVKQYVDGQWVEVEELGRRMEEEKMVVVNPDGTITVTGLETAPIAFFTK